MSIQDQICFLGTTEIDYQTKAFGVLNQDRRRHMYILGKSGVGKSTLLENMILQDIYAGRGVAFIDPLGDSAESIIDRIPSYRYKDVIYFNPADLDYPIGINMLEKDGEQEDFLIASGLMAVLQKIWAGAWSARMEYFLNNAVLALLEVPGNSLLGITKIFTDKQFRKYVVENCENILVKNFWLEEYPKFSQNYVSEAVAPIINKVGQFFASSMMRNILGQSKSSIQFRKTMDQGKIFIANLSKGRLGEDNSKLLGGMLISKIQLSAMSRANIPENQRADFYLYVDEFHNMVNESFSTILSEARKYRLNLIVAHQYINQLSEIFENDKIKNAIFGNVGTIVSFLVGIDDAEILAKQMFPGVEKAEDWFLSLDRAQVFVKLFVQSKSLNSILATTLPPLYQEMTGNYSNVVSHSRKQFGCLKVEVEEEIFDYFNKSLTTDPETGEKVKVRVPKRKRKKPSDNNFKTITSPIET